MRFLLPLVAVWTYVLAVSASLHPRAQSDAPNGTASDSVTNQAMFEEDFGTSERQLAFAVTVNNTDIRFRISGPAIFSYVAFGTGSNMKDSLMFIIYRDTKDKVVLSPRWSTGDLEPQYTDKVDLTVIQPLEGDIMNGEMNNMMYITALCRNCTHGWGKELFPKTTQAPFIWALGPRDRDPTSDSKNAPLRRHYHTGSFSLNLKDAQSQGIPTIKGKKSSDSTHLNEIDRTDHDFPESGHTFSMLFAFLIVFPAGIWFQRILERPKIHMIFQTVGLLLVLIGFITGIIISRLYNRSQKYTTAHQIIGIVVVLLILVQWCFGFFSHRKFVKTGSPIAWAIKSHKLALGPIAMVLAYVNGALGLRLALAPTHNYYYIPFVALVMIFLVVSVYSKGFFHSRWGNKQHAHPVPAYSAQEDGVSRPLGTGPYSQSGAYVHRSDIALGHMDAPPAYSEQPQKPREFA